MSDYNENLRNSQNLNDPNNPNNPNNPNDPNNQEEKKKKKWVKWVILGIIIIILLLLLRCCGSETPTPGGDVNINIGGPTLELDPNAGEYVEPEKPAPSKGVAIPGWGSITIPANKTDVSVDFYNPEANKDLYYLTFELRLPNDSEQGYEVLYKSGLVEPTLHIQKITLNRPLEAGTYDAIIHVQPYKMDGHQTPTNNADMKTTIIVK